MTAWITFKHMEWKTLVFYVQVVLNLFRSMDRENTTLVITRSGIKYIYTLLHNLLFHSTWCSAGKMNLIHQEFKWYWKSSITAQRLNARYLRLYKMPAIPYRGKMIYSLLMIYWRFNTGSKVRLLKKLSTTWV